MEFEPLSAHLIVAWSATPFQDAVNDRAVPRLLELVRAEIDLGGRGPELLKSAIEAEMDDSRRTGDEAHADLTTLLLMAGADPRRTGGGVSALEVAAELGHWFAALLIERWGRPPLADSYPLGAPQPEESIWELDTALHVDRFRDAYDMLAAGADVHAEVGRNTLLIQALHGEDDGYAQTGEMHLDGSALLLAMGADPWRPPRSAPGPTAAQIADSRYPAAALLYRNWRDHGQTRTA
jgi:hypothetical protein